MRNSIGPLWVGFAAICILLVAYFTWNSNRNVDNAGNMMMSSLSIRKSSTQALGVTKDNGQPELDHLRANSISHDLTQYDLEKLTLRQALLTLHSYLDNLDVVCERKIRMGNIASGGYEICDDEWVRPVPPCLVYSVGIKKDWTFDDDISRLYGCTVHSFDPSIDLDKHYKSELVHFHQWGLSNRTFVHRKGWKMYSFTTIREKLGHSTTMLDVFKVDAETEEWSTLIEAQQSGQLDYVRQLSLEFHTWMVKTREKALYSLKVLQMLEREGFRKYYVYKVPMCPQKKQGFPVTRTSCYEVHYVKVH